MTNSEISNELVKLFKNLNECEITKNQAVLLLDFIPILKLQKEKIIKDIEESVLDKQKLPSVDDFIAWYAPISAKNENGNLISKEWIDDECRDAFSIFGSFIEYFGKRE